MEKTKISTILVLALGLVICLPKVSQAEPMGTAWTYQGRLLDDNRPAEGIYDALFVLRDSPEGPNEVGIIGIQNFDIFDGYFTVELDFGSNVFDGTERWLEVYIRPGDFNDPCEHTILGPRQKITPAPYALFALNGGGDNLGNHIATENIILNGNWLSGISEGGGICVDASGRVGIGTDQMGTTIFENSLTINAPLSNMLMAYPSLIIGNDGYSGIVLGKDASNYGMVTWVDPNYLRISAPGNDIVFEYMSNVGIGTSNPSQKLDVDNGDIIVQGPDSFDSIGHQASVYLGSVHHYVRGEYGFGVKIGTYAAGDVLSIRELSGNVGIGTTTPTTALDVVGTVNASAFVGDGSGLWGIPGGSAWTQSGGNVYRQTGKVGIGTTTPTEALEVVGTVNAIAFVGDGSALTGISGGKWSDGAAAGVIYYNGGKVGIGTTTPIEKLEVEGTIKAVNSSGTGVFGQSTSGNGVTGYTYNGNAVYGIDGSGTGLGYAGFFEGNVLISADCSASTFTDLTPYPKDLKTAYEAVMSMERLPDGQYEENNKEVQLDHSKLSDFIRSKDGNRDLSATVSCHNEILKDLTRKQQELGKAHIYIEQLQKQNELLEERLVKLETMIIPQAGR